MDRNNIQEILKKIKTGQNAVGVVGNESTMAINALSKSVPITWFEQFGSALVDQILDELVQVHCPDWAVDHVRNKFK